LRAEVREKRMGDPSAALDETLRSFAIEPSIPRTQEEILRLSRVTGRWEEAIRVQGQLFALAEELPEKLAVARNAAHLVEHEVKDLVRAFRAYLNAFRLAPDDEEIVAHLWRLAAEIGTYDHPPAPEPAAAGAEAESDVEAPWDAEAESTAEAADSGLDVVSVEVDTDLEGAPGEEDETGAPAPMLASPELGVSDSGAVAVDDDAIEVIGEEELLEEPEAELARPPSTPPALHEDQPFHTPWEELAAAYESLPAEDADARWVYLRKIAEVWERGQHDVDRALDALERAFKLDITDVDVRNELERIGATYDRWDRIAKIYLGAIDEFGPIETSVVLHHDAARLRERLGQIAEAE